MKGDGEKVENCGNCRFFAADFEECRRRAPIALPRMFYALCIAICRPDAEADELMSGRPRKGGWAEVYDWEWCGEWEPNTANPLE